MIALPKSKASVKRERAKSGEAALLRKILDALNALDYVTAWRNNTGVLRDRNDRPVSYGLCVGSSDIVGIVKSNTVQEWQGGYSYQVGRFFALEVKRPGEEPTEDQLRFLDIVRGRGGAAHWVDTLDGAWEFIQRVRDPRHDR